MRFEELSGCLMREHERHEAEYTPAIYDVNALVEWDFGEQEAAVVVVRGDGEKEERRVKDVEMRSKDRSFYLLSFPSSFFLSFFSRGLSICT